MLCAVCAEALPVTGVALALVDEQGPAGPAVATDGLSKLLEEPQFSLGEGPRFDSSTQARSVLQPQLRATGPARWPGLGRAAVEARIEAIFTFPLQVGSIRLGMLDRYRDTPGMLCPEALREALHFADASVRILLHPQDQMPLGGRLHPDLAGVSSRREVHQATGMIAVRAGVNINDAVLLLRAHAYSAERSILSVDHEVVTPALRFNTVNAGDA